MAKDYYKILGVKETDSRDIIKKAYRDAVKRLHPDTKKGEFDKNRFYEIQEAYETLGNEERRRRYDASRETASTPQRRFRRMEEVFPHGWDFMDAWMTPWRSRVSLHEEFTEWKGVEVSHRATLTLTSEEALRGIQMTLWVPLKSPCGLCGGTGRIGLFTCPLCGGEDKFWREFPIRIVIPPGIEDGEILQVPFEDQEGIRHVVILSIEIDWFA